jgi:DNA-binding transcriptional LysR family regulator
MNQVRYFVALCEEKHFTRAAARCGVAQPSLTTAVKKLERELGGPLFDRKRSEPTELGLLVEPFLREIAWNAETATSRALSFANAAGASPDGPSQNCNGHGRADHASAALTIQEQRGIAYR